MGMTGSGGSAIPSINVTPLIDILLVLLIIFMVITPLKPARFKTLVPEKSENLNAAAKQSPLTLIVNIKKDLSAELVKGGNHVVNNMPYAYRPLVADWVADHLYAGHAPSIRRQSQLAAR